MNNNKVIFSANVTVSRLYMLAILAMRFRKGRGRGGGQSEMKLRSVVYKLSLIKQLR